MIETGLYNLLATTSSITALVGTRIHPIVLPEGGTLPALTYRGIGGGSEPTLRTSGFQRKRVEINCWGSTAMDAWALRDAVRAALDGYAGLLSNGTLLQNVQWLQDIDDFETDARGFRVLVEYYLFFDLQ